MEWINESKWRYICVINSSKDVNNKTQIRTPWPLVRQRTILIYSLVNRAVPNCLWYFEITLGDNKVYGQTYSCDSSDRTARVCDSRATNTTRGAKQKLSKRKWQQKNRRETNVRNECRLGDQASVRMWDVAIGSKHNMCSAWNLVYTTGEGGHILSGSKSVMARICKSDSCMPNVT
jgi:hypothetical protein